jgi:hypothetical protein
MEFEMRKSRTNIQTPDHETLDNDLLDARPGRIQGATITSWPGPPEVDLASLFAKPDAGGTVSGSTAKPAAPVPVHNQSPRTISLSDGTEITFATADQLANLETI